MKICGSILHSCETLLVTQSVHLQKDPYTPTYKLTKWNNSSHASCVDFDPWESDSDPDSDSDPWSDLNYRSEVPLTRQIMVIIQLFHSLKFQCGFNQCWTTDKARTATHPTTSWYANLKVQHLLTPAHSLTHGHQSLFNFDLTRESLPVTLSFLAFHTMLHIHTWDSYNQSFVKQLA